MSPLEPDPADTGEGSAAPRDSFALRSLPTFRSERDGIPTKPARPARKRPEDRPPSDRPTARPSGDYGEAFPNSKKVYLEGPQGIRVPMREIGLSGGEPPTPGVRHQRAAGIRRP